ncbi:MAG: hypothetical protein PHY92_09530 [Alphaproteobacteria bacterium]|nr:hypothetical protein [Alphaproteobacteria bacterium]
MRFRLVLTALVLASLSFPALATPPADTFEPEDDCYTLGATHMSNNNDSLVICALKTGNGAAKCSDNMDGCKWKTMTGGMASYTYYCYFNPYYGAPLCPALVTMGTQGPCNNGFTVVKDLGVWGYCGSVDGTGHYGMSGPLPYSAIGGSGWDAGCYGIGEAFLCAGGTPSTGTVTPYSVCPVGSNLKYYTGTTPHCG